MMRLALERFMAGRTRDALHIRWRGAPPHVAITVRDVVWLPPHQVRSPYRGLAVGNCRPGSIAYDPAALKKQRKTGVARNSDPEPF